MGRIEAGEIAQLIHGLIEDAQLHCGGSYTDGPNLFDLQATISEAAKVDPRRDERQFAPAAISPAAMTCRS